MRDLEQETFPVWFAGMNVHYYGARQLHAHCSRVEVAIAMQSSASQALKLPLPILQYPIEASAPAITSCHDPRIIQEEDDDDLSSQLVQKSLM